MPPEHSRDLLFDVGRQQDHNQHNVKRHFTPTRPTHSIATGLKAQPTSTVTTYPTREFEDLSDTANAQIFEDNTPLPSSSHLDYQTLQTSADFSAQYPYGSYLTPDHGSDNPFSEQSSYNSPSLDDIYWQEQYTNSQSLDDLGDDPTLVNNPFNELNPSDDLQGIVPKVLSPEIMEPRSLTPRISTATASATSTYPQAHSVSQHPTSSNMDAQHNKRTYDSHDDQAEFNDRHSRAISSQQPREANIPTMPQNAHPTVLVSTYNRGDSPARTELPLARSLSKRSQSSRLSDRGETVPANENDQAEAESSNSRLMPPDHYGDSHWSNDDEADHEPTRAGVAPVDRHADTIPSLNDMEKQRELEETRVGVQNWLATSETGSPTAPGFRRNRSRKERIRSRSTDARINAEKFSDQHILGPGVLLAVDSEDDYSDDDSSYVPSDQHSEGVPASPPAHVETIDPSAEGSYFPSISEDDVAPDELEPLPRQFYRRGPWQDPVRFAEIVSARDQPATSNHAIMQYDQLATRFETTSRVATWGTRRRLSDSEIASIVEGSKVRQLSLGDKARDRGNSFINKARTAIRRSSSTIKKSKDHSQRQQSPPIEADKSSSHDNDLTHQVSPVQQIQRQFSWGKPKSPPMTSTSGAFMAMTGQLTAVGSNVTNSVEAHERPKTPFLSALKRSRSRSDIPRASKGTPGLSDLFNRHGGPPVPTLASPMQRRAEISEANSVTATAGNADDEMEDGIDEEIPVKMELLVKADNIIPTLDGFRTHAKQLNPRLEQYLIERIALDQVRRYKKLVKAKIDHTRSVQLKRQCPSGTLCKDLGGKPRILPPRSNNKDTNVNHAQFRIGNGGDSDDESGFAEGGVVTPALFPQGIPLPPATHLPAEFECPLCFQVKKFQKPSDWTKHVHEDVQPFSCSFAHCPEPKSFKRKADWVRHENERHRHLEWWRCSIPECAHVCYRKDNFVQHLVREHKMSEPKSKNQKTAGKGAKPAARSGQNLGYDADDFWQTVEHCRHDTSLTPKNEPCKFCGNVCSTWKKLSVHVGKHMEQIAMPVLDLVAKRIINADTIISPVDPPNQRTTQGSTLDTAVMNGNHYDSLSPYTASAQSVYHSSSAGQSPVPMNSVHVQSASPAVAFYEAGMMHNEVPAMTGNMQPYTEPNVMHQSFSYPAYEVSNAPNYPHLQHQAIAFSQQTMTPNVSAPYQPQQVPRSQPMDSGYGGLNVNTMQGPIYAHDQYYASSAPSNSFMTGYHNGIPRTDGLHSPHHVQAGQLHSPVSAQPHGNDYVFPHDQNGTNGGLYFQ